RHEPLEDDGAVLIDLELREERAVVEADPELVALLRSHALEARHDGVVAGTALLLREQVPPDLALVGELHIEFLRESAEIRHGADRHAVVKAVADLHGTARTAPRPTKGPALKPHSAATLVA